MLLHLLSEMFKFYLSWNVAGQEMSDDPRRDCLPSCVRAASCVTVKCRCVTDVDRMASGQKASIRSAFRSEMPKTSVVANRNDANGKVASRNAPERRDVSTPAEAGIENRHNLGARISASSTRENDLDHATRNITSLE